MGFATGLKRFFGARHERKEERVDEKERAEIEEEAKDVLHEEHQVNLRLREVSGGVADLIDHVLKEIQPPDPNEWAELKVLGREGENIIRLVNMVVRSARVSEKQGHLRMLIGTYQEWSRRIRSHLEQRYPQEYEVARELGVNILTSIQKAENLLNEEEGKLRRLASAAEGLE